MNFIFILKKNYLNLHIKQTKKSKIHLKKYKSIKNLIYLKI